MTASVYQSNRKWEIDALRGAAVVAMILFHTVFDLAVYFGFNIEYLQGIWFVIGRSSALLFMFMSGVSSCFSKRPFARSLQIFLCAMLVTAVSIPVMGENYIRFGILHFFAAVMVINGIIKLWVKDARAMNLMQLCIIPLALFLGRVVQSLRWEQPYLIPLGIIPPGFTSYDYYPIFPWSAFFAMGVLFAGISYSNGKRPVRWSPFHQGRLTKGAGRAAQAFFAILCFLGRHSLVVYMLHQPLILAGLYVLL